VNRRLRSFLRGHGAPDDEIARAERAGRLAVLAVERTLMPGRPRYSFAEAAERAGVEPGAALRLWRALGFPDPPPDAKRFTDEDVESLVTLRDWFRDTTFPREPSLERLVQNVRVVGGALAKIAEVQSDEIVAGLAQARAAGLDDEALAMLIVSSFDWSRLARLMDYALRLQLRAAVLRKLSGSDPTGEESLAVGFVDLVGYTALSQELDAEQLAELVTRFEGIAYDTVAEHAGRVVKTIGDEVMFVNEDVRAAARIALRLTEHSAVDELLPDARAGLAFGSVLAQEGDYYGPVVNLASRLVGQARPGSVLTSSDVREALRDDPEFSFHRLRSRRIRDIGRVEVWSLVPARQRASPRELAEGQR
jgi:adenylate cyclase